MSMRLLTLGGLTLQADGWNPAGLAAQPVRASLLVYLGVQRQTTREAVMAILWPEHEPRAARHVLSQTLYELRRDLGDDWIEGEGQTLQATSRLYTDAPDFVDAVESDEWERALTLYQGHFLEGHHLIPVGPFENWVDRQRSQLSRLHRRARRARVSALVASGDLERALECARGWVELDPFEDEGQHALIQLLFECGDGEEALRQYQLYARLLAREELEPLPETKELAERIRSSAQDRAAASSAPAEAAPASRLPGSRVELEGGGARSWRRGRVGRRWSRVATVVGLALVAAVGLFELVGLGSRADLEERRAVVLPFVNETGDPSLDMVGEMAADWITQGLAGTAHLQVVPLASVMGSLRFAPRSDGGDMLTQARSVATRNHAGLLVTGRYFRRGDELEFYAQVTDLRSDELWYAPDPVRAPAAAPAAAIAELAQRITGALAARFQRGVPLEEPSVLHPPTYEAYQAMLTGVELFMRGDYRSAIPHFRRAASLDTAFVRALFVEASSHFNLGEYRVADSIIGLVERRQAHLAPYERVHLAMTRAWLDGDRIAALDATRRIAELAPGGPAHYLLAREALSVGRPREALRLFTTLEPEPPWWPEWTYGRNHITTAYHVLGRHRRESDEARAARAAHPGRLLIVYAELRALAALGRGRELEERLPQVTSLAAESDLDAGDVLRWTAIELEAHRQPELAARTAELALTWYETRAPTAARRAQRYGLAQTYHSAGLIGQADSVVSQLRAEEPENIDYLGMSGVLAARRGDARRAEAVADELAQIRRPYDFGATTYWRACIAAQLGRVEESFALLEQAFREGRRLGAYLHADLNLEPLWHLGRFHSLVDGGS